MKIDLRWIIQALAFVGCIFFFMQVWSLSKKLIASFDTLTAIWIGLNALLFLICFFMMAATSYLKQRNNGTLKNPIPLFEKLLSKVGLA